VGVATDIGGSYDRRDEWTGRSYRRTQDFGGLLGFCHITHEFVKSRSVIGFRSAIDFGCKVIQKGVFGHTPLYLWSKFILIFIYDGSIYTKCNENITNYGHLKTF
jgi:hypothetical protein